ncbi:MAG TPA: hypothetical protein VJC06_00075 [Candidatus Paceibacterota bacterium]
MNRNLLITLTVLSVSFTAFLSGYLISQKDFLRNPDSILTGDILDKFSDIDPSPSPQAGYSETLRLLSQRSVISPVLSKEKDSVVYYEKETGKVFEVTLKDLREKSVSDTLLANLIKTVWAPSRKEVVSLFSYPNGDHYKYFNYKTRASTDLGTEIKSLSFSPDGSQVAYFGSKDGSQGIFLSQPNGSSFKKLLPSRLENTEIYWPLDDLLAFRTEVVDGFELYSLSKAGEIKKILDSRAGLEVKWSGDGSRVLFSQKVESGIGLFYKDVHSESETSLNVATEASKCDWGIDNKTVICGVPKSSASGDEIYEINLDGTKKLLSSPTSRINTQELFLSGLDDYVIILNSLDNKLYVLKK